MIDEIIRRVSRQLKGVNHTMEIQHPKMSYAPVKIDELVFMFVVAAVGIALSCIIFIFELLSNVNWRKLFNQLTKKYSK